MTTKQITTDEIPSMKLSEIIEMIEAKSLPEGLLISANRTGGGGGSCSILGMRLTISQLASGDVVAMKEVSLERGEELGLEKYDGIGGYGA